MMTTPAPVFPSFTYEELIARPLPPYLVQGRIFVGSAVVLTANPKVGKTFLAIDLAMSIGTGQPQWKGEKILKHGPVVYVIGEGVGRFKCRLLAWVQRAKELGIPLPTWPPALTVVPRAVDLTNEEEVKRFLALFGSIEVVAYMFDTMSRCMPGKNENAPEVMTAAVQSLDRIRETTGAMTLGLHHVPGGSGKQAGKSTKPRGHTSLIGGLDTQIHLIGSHDDPEFTVTCQAQRDDEEFKPFALRRRRIVLPGLVEPITGAPVTSVVLEPVAAQQTEVPAADRVKDEVLALARAGDFTRTEIYEQVTGKRQTKVDAVDGLLETGQLVEARIGKRTVLKPRSLEKREAA